MPTDTPPAPPEDEDDDRSGDLFATTQWSVVVAAAGSRDRQEVGLALEQLCRAYWRPLHDYVLRRVRHAEEAQDLTQAFFERLLEKDFLAQADPARGRFRAFLLASFKHFLANQWQRGQAQKRGGGRTILPLDFSHAGGPSEAEIASDDLTPEKRYEQQWATTLLQQVMDRLERECQRRGQARLFERLKPLLVRTQEDSPKAAAADLQMSEAAVRMALSRLRARYRELLSDEIARTVATPEEIEDEIRDLFQAFR